MAVKILVVDDDRRIVKTTCDILRVKGHEAIAAYSGEEGVAMALAESPDCVLMDIRMPGITGVEAMKRMMAATPGLPVILVSAYATDDLLDEAKRAGVYAILSKPLDIQRMLSFFDLLRKEESVLVVDDDPNFCKTLKDILTLRGFRVQTEGAAGAVLDDIERDHQLVVLLDLKLGEADGLEVFRRIREKYPSMVVILVTGFRQEMTAGIEQAMRIGAYACLYKPLEIEALLGMIEKIRLAKLRNMLAPT